MSEYTDQRALTFTAAADLSGNQYGIMCVSAARTVNVASLNTSRTIMGVLQNVPESGQAATVAVAGVTKVKAGAAISADDYLTCNGSGDAITKPSSGTYVVIGRALDAAGAAGQYISCKLEDPREITD